VPADPGSAAASAHRHVRWPALAARRTCERFVPPVSTSETGREPFRRLAAAGGRIPGFSEAPTATRFAPERPARNYVSDVGIVKHFGAAPSYD